jgi:hypothetical protein
MSSPPVADPDADDPFAGYLLSLETPWPREAVASVVRTIRSSGPFEEAIKWGHPYFGVGGRAVVKLFTARDWINVYFFRGVDLRDDAGLLEPEERKRMRKTRVHRDDVVPPQLAELVREARALEARPRHGGP